MHLLFLFLIASGMLLHSSEQHYRQEQQKCHLLHAMAAIPSLGTSPAHSWCTFTTNMLILQISSSLPCFIRACIYLLHEVSPCLEKMWQFWSYCANCALPLLHKELGHLATCSGLQKALPGALHIRGRNCSNLKQNQEILPLDKSCWPVVHFWNIFFWWEISPASLTNLVAVCFWHIFPLHIHCHDVFLVANT